MRYLLALVLPPIAVLVCGKPGQAILNFFLTCLGIVPGVIHALLVVNSTKADQRNQELIRAMGRQDSGFTSIPAVSTLPPKKSNLAFILLLGLGFFIAIPIVISILFGLVSSLVPKNESYPQPRVISAVSTKIESEILTVKAIAEDKKIWPKNVVLLEKAEFPIFVNGQQAGYTTVQAGTTVELLFVDADGTAEVSHGKSKVRVPAEKTTLLAMVKQLRD